MKTPITYYGGKQSMLSIILPLIPKHRIYVEPFVGGGAVYWSKLPSEVEVINDLNSEVVNFYKVAKASYGALQKLIRATLHSRETHRHASIIYSNPTLFSKVQRAWAFWVLACQSYSASLTSGWRYARSNKVEKLVERKRNHFVMEISERLSKTQVEHTDALRVIRTRDTDETFFYCDPPYFNADMGHYGGYTQEDFKKLLEKLSTIKGKFILSSYPSPLLSEYIGKCGWHTMSFDRKVPLGKLGSKRKQEVITANFPLKYYHILQNE